MNINFSFPPQFIRFDEKWITEFHKLNAHLIFLMLFGFSFSNNALAIVSDERLQNDIRQLFKDHSSPSKYHRYSVDTKNYEFEMYDNIAYSKCQISYDEHTILHTQSDREPSEEKDTVLKMRLDLSRILSYQLSVMPTVGIESHTASLVLRLADDKYQRISVGGNTLFVRPENQVKLANLYLDQIELSESWKAFKYAVKLCGGNEQFIVPKSLYDK